MLPLASWVKGGRAAGGHKGIGPLFPRGQGAGAGDYRGLTVGLKKGGGKGSGKITHET